MRHPGAVLQSIQRQQPADYRQKRYALMGVNPYIKSMFRRLLTPRVTSIVEEVVDVTDVRQSLLRISDYVETKPFTWELPMIWVEGADQVFAAMSFPEDFTPSDHIIVCCSETEEVYVPSSFVPVATQMKGAGAPLQEFVRWLLVYKGLSGEIEAIRFMASEYKDDLPALEKLMDQLYISIHPRSTVVLKDIESDINLEWDSDAILKAVLDGDEGKAMKEMVLALKTFHPKGIVTVLSRRVSLLLQISVAIVLNAGAPDPSGDIRPWVWRNNLEFVKTIPNMKLFKWSVALDKAYSTLSRGSISSNWTLFNLITEMTRT